MRTNFTRMLAGMLFCLFAIGADAQVYVRVNSPAEIAGTYPAVAAAFGPAITTEGAYDLSRPSVDTLGCDSLAIGAQSFANFAGLVNRGSCTFSAKAVNLQAAMASAMIVCNHANNPPYDSNAIYAMPPAPAVLTPVTIPCAMVSFNSFLAWQPYMATGINASIVPASPGDYSTIAIDVVEGMNMATGPVAPSASHFPAAHAARWYRFVAAADGAIIISSCGGGVDTRLYVHANTVGNIIKENDDCDPMNSDYGSGTSFTVIAGYTYYFEWDDTWSTDDFSFMFMMAPAPEATDNCTQALDVAPGTYTTEVMDYPSATAPDVVFARWYKYTATGPGTISINSCLGGVDTRLFVYSGDCYIPVLVAENDDFCEITPGGNVWASGVSDIAVETGMTYYIEWDAKWSTEPFDWTLTFNPLLVPVAITLQVDMSTQTVGANGVHVAGDFQSEAGFPSDWDPSTTAMDDTDGDGIYTYTFSPISGTSFQYKFINGNAWGSDENVPAECGIGNPSNRTFTAGGSDETVPLVCFATCGPCVFFECNPSDIICDNFETYTLGALGPQADFWTTWSGTEGGAEDGIVSADMASSGLNSMKIEGTTAQDVVLDLGDNTSGNYELRWKMNIPATHTGYFNLQGSPAIGTVYNYEIYFDDADTGRVVVGATVPASFAYVHDTWMDIVQRFDLDNNNTQLWINGALVHTVTTDINVASIDFYSAAATNLYYVDEVHFTALALCNPDAVLCDGLEAYADGSAPFGQAAWWSTWSQVGGGADDGIISTEQVQTGYNSLKIDNAAGDDVVLKLGDLTSGHYELHFSYYVPTGSGAYYNTQKVQNAPGQEFGSQFNLNVDGTITGDFGGTANVTGTYPHDEWFQISHDYDLDNNALIISINGVVVATGTVTNQAQNTAQGLNQLGGVNFYGNTNNLFYVDNIELIALDPIVIVVNHDVTFEVDMDYLINNELGTVSANGVHLAGDLQSEAGFPGDWDPATTALTQVAGTNKYTVTLSLPDGSYQYKFVNSNAWDGNDESVTGDCAVAGGGNRAITVAGANMTAAYCYRWCASCPVVVGDQNVAFDQAISIAPNPTKSETVVSYNFDEASDLTLNVYNSIGQKISTRSLGYVQAGATTVDVNNLPNGLYFIEMTNGANRASKRLVVQK